MAYSKEIPAYPDIEYLLLTCFCPLRTTAIGRFLPKGRQPVIYTIPR